MNRRKQMRKGYYVHIVSKKSPLRSYAEALICRVDECGDRLQTVAIVHGRTDNHPREWHAYGPLNLSKDYVKRCYDIHRIYSPEEFVKEFVVKNMEVFL